MNAKMAAEMAELQMQQARENEKRIFEAEKVQYAKDQMSFGVIDVMPPVPPPPSGDEVLESKRDEMNAKRSNVGVGGSWPTRAKTTVIVAENTDYEELD